jgi:hypothetical protein
MGKKGKGTSGTRTRNQRKKKPEDDDDAPLGPISMHLDFDLALQRATQGITNEYEDKMRKTENLHRKEIQNFLDGQRTFVKPRWIDRIRGRFKDLYLVYNHLQPIYCHRTDCTTKAEGVNWGIECLTLDLDVALGHIDEYLMNFPNRGSAKLLHIQIDRFKNRTGVVVSDVSYNFKNWDVNAKRFVREKMEFESVEERIVASLVEDRKEYRQGKRRTK